MPEWFPAVPGVLGFIVLIGAAIAAGVTIKKYVVDPVRQFNVKVNKGMDSLLGYAAVTDPATGREIQPATPPIADRVYDLEQTFKKVAEALDAIAQNQRAVIELQARWDEQNKAGEQIIREWTEWRKAHEVEADAREQRLAEWDKWRQEQTVMVEAMKHAHDLPHREHPL